LAAIIIPGQSGTYRHQQGRVTGLPAESGQIRLTTDVSLGVECSETLTEADAAIEIVQTWLQEMADTAP
jgi:hypothetical protein